MTQLINLFNENEEREKRKTRETVIIKENKSTSN